MNVDMIKQIEKQTWIEFSNTGGSVTWSVWRDKFAELIVKECSQVSEDDITDGDACCSNTADRIARQIRKHFGIEQ